MLNPLTDSTAPVVNKRPINLDLLYKYSPTPAVDLRKGKQIIAFMSLTCPHCKKAAYLLHIIHKQHPDYPLYMVLDGAPEHKNAFFSETHAEDVPYLLYRHTEEFVDMAGSGVPSIYWFKDGQAVLKSEYAYYQLDPSYMGKWLKQ
ncbi:MAG: hypothetical protein EBX41_09420 [Chitinophagia bacterium]|nr:hypothetical protein [Chitinophagia bacterium]